ncbi:hypothetical protein SteCoe_32279 [Stentor coeruleus]|uniref:Uncharacterized protein n=1 Tax=Stentor coeruleus TaxID=5963 RepID=A0A1R2AZF3_9CILI|nr:hypothetical protein SteCoe_32279 [Stentor coeruleus]
MTEENLIKFLSEESEKISSESIKSRQDFDTGICGWKDTNTRPSNKISNPEAPKFRIRVVGNRNYLTRSVSSTVSSNNESWNNSPNSEKSPSLRKSNAPDEQVRRRLASFNAYQNEDVPVEYEDNQVAVNIIRIYKSPNPRRSRKPIKVFRLPRVQQWEEE